MERLPVLLELEEASRAALVPPVEALQRAQQCLEMALEGHESWRALKQLQAREDAGEWLDVMESDVLRDRLLQALASDPDFMAWQFVDAALGCLDANERAKVATLVEPASLSLEPADVMPIAPAAPTVVPALSPPTLEPLFVPCDHHSQVSVPPTRGLSLRIPTLQRHDMRSRGDTRALVDAEYAVRTSAVVAARASDAPRSFDEARTLSGMVPTPVPPGPLEADDTRFDIHAIGIEEADVHIVVRSSKPAAMIETRLPPLPLTEPGQKLPRASRASNLKWSDEPEDARDGYRPVGSAMDEAQVTIIAVGVHSEAETRATRRALGIAPDRENQMRRFFKALAGDEATYPTTVREADVSVVLKRD
jgi:hypothetical protein